MSVAGMSDYLVRANRTYRAEFMHGAADGEARYSPIVNSLCRTVPSAGRGNEYNLGDDPPEFEEFDGERKLVPLGVKGWRLENVEYSVGVSIRDKDFKDDMLGLHSAQINAMGMGYWRLLMKLLKDLFNAGFATAHYDGVYFFSDSHPNNGNTNDNLSTDILDGDALIAAIKQLRDMKSTTGEYLQLNPTHLIYGHDLEATANDLLFQTIQSTGESNVMLRYGIKPLMIPGITSTNWGLADLSWPVKPFILQTREALSFTEVVDPRNPMVFMQKLFNYGADWRGAIGFGHYQFIVGSTGAS